MAETVQSILNEKGIEHHRTMPGSPQQNGKAERFNCTIMDKAMAMLHAAGLSLGFWECAVDTAVHVYNRTPTRTLGWRTPYELWNSGQIPDVSHFRIFGCKGYMHVPDNKRRKLDAKAIEVTLVGYESGAKGYRLWDKHTHSLKLSRDVTFDESVFPSLQGVELRPAPVSPAPSAQAPIIPSPAVAAPNPPAAPPADPPAQPPSRESSVSTTDSEASVKNILCPTSEQPESERPHCYDRTTPFTQKHRTASFLFLLSYPFHRSPCMIRSDGFSSVRYDLMTSIVLLCTISISEPHILRYLVLGELRSLSP